jgi:hypothetical protein
MTDTTLLPQKSDISWIFLLEGSSSPAWLE